MKPIDANKLVEGKSYKVKMVGIDDDWKNAIYRGILKSSTLTQNQIHYFSGPHDFYLVAKDDLQTRVKKII